MVHALVIATIVVINWVVVVVLTFRHAMGRTSVGVMRRLRNAGDQQRIRSGRLDWSGIWNPAESARSFSRIYGQGVGVYWLDDESNVHLTWTPKSGPEQHLVGPMPKRLDKRSPARRRVRLLTWTILAVYGASLVLKFAVGYGWSTGSSGGRVLIGAFGAVGAYFAVYFVILVAVAVGFVRKHSRDAADQADLIGGRLDVVRPFVASVAVALMSAAGLTACSGGDDSPATSPRATPPGSVGASSEPRGVGFGEAVDWPMYHGMPDRGGLSESMPAASGAPQMVQSIELDGDVLASPIVVGGLTIVATENDSVYAFDQSYREVWKRTLGSPSPAEERQCGDIDPLGITGTPVYEASTGDIYLVAEQGGSVRHTLFALDADSGQTEWSKSVDLPGVSARDMQQRGALAVANGKVWVSFGAQAGDCGNYKGRVVGVPLDGGSDVVFYSPPTERGGGIWNPNGPTVDSSGNLLVVSANGAAFPGDDYDFTNSVLELDGDAQVVDSFAPQDWAENNRGDVGLGSQGVALIGDTWIVLGGKSGPVYVLEQGELGGIDGQVDVEDICVSFGGAAVDGNVAYLPCIDGVRAVRVDDAGQLHVLWHADTSITGSPVIGGGRVWVMDTEAGVLHALDRSTGHSLAQVSVGEANRFATPTIYGPDVIVGTLTGVAVVRTS